MTSSTDPRKVTPLATRMLLGILASGVAVTAGLCFGVAGASATANDVATSSPSGAAVPRIIQGGTCNAFAGAYALGASYSDAKVVVPACGPHPNRSGGPAVHPYPGSLSTSGYQCVEFSERYLYYEFGVTMGSDTNGDQVAAHYAAKYPSLFTVVANGTANHAPVQGDVFSFSDVSSFHSGSGGHTAVVQSSSVNPSGTGTVTIIEENNSATGSRTLSISGWRVVNSGFTFAEWLHPASLPGASGPAVVHTSVAMIPGQPGAGYELTGFGSLIAFGGAPAVTSPVNWGSWDIARALVVIGPGEGYILDGYGGLHPFGGAPTLADSTYWPGWDIARGLALCPGDKGGYVLDGYGGIHPIGDAAALPSSTYWSGWDIARGIVVNSTCTGGYILDGYGGVHPFGNSPSVTTTGYWSGWDIARSITLVSDTSGYVLDGYGGIHPFAAPGTAMPPSVNGATYHGGSDVYRSIVLDPESGVGVQATGASGSSFTTAAAGQINVITETLVHTSVAMIPGEPGAGYVLTGYGDLIAFGGAPAVTSPVSWSVDIARALVVIGPGEGYILDGYGGLHPFGGAPTLADSTYWPGWDIARGLALCPGDEGGYVLDGYGGIHPIGNAAALPSSTYWSGWDIARGIVVNSTCTGGYILDGYGGVHPFGNSPSVTTTGYWSGWDIARSITLVSDTSGYVLDGYGGIHPFAVPGTVMPANLSNPGYDAAASDPFDALAVNPNGLGVAVTKSYTTGQFELINV